MRKILSAFLLAAIVMSTGLIGHANEAEYVINSELTNVDESSYEVFTIQRGTYLLAGSGTITNPAIGYVGASASTVARYSVPTVSVTVYLQRYNGSSWTTVSSWSAKGTNTNYVGTDKLFSVTRGYYYRVYSVHNANGETAFGATNGIYIS